MAISVSDLVSPSGTQDITAVETPAPAAGTAPWAHQPGGPQPTSQPGVLQEPLTPKDESKAVIPDEVLKLPAFRALLQGSPPAVKVTQAEFQSDPTVATIQGFAEPLLYSGFGFYQPKDGQSSVIYNSQFIDGKALKIADDKGQLDTIAAPYSELKAFFDQNIGEAAVEGAAPAAAAPPGASGAPAPASTQTKLATSRINNLATGSPASGAAPGAGRVLNNILKSTV